MNETPLSQPADATCPNCGAPHDTGAIRCANCGAVFPKTKKPSQLAMVAKIMVAVILWMTALGFGVIGACLFVVGSMSTSGTSTGGSTGVDTTFEGAKAILGIAAVAAILAIAWTVFWIRKQK